MTRTGLECFVRLVQLNPSIPSDSPIWRRALDAYGDETLFPDPPAETVDDG